MHTFAYINTDHLRHNYCWLKKKHLGPLLAVIKSDAYGHGLESCANAIADIADGFAVMHLEEAIALRSMSLKNPILLLEGLVEKEALFEAANYNLWLAIQNQQQLDNFLSTDLPCPLSVWLNMDTGLHRGGILPQDYESTYQALDKNSNTKNIVYMTHFACADEVDNPMTDDQITQFENICSHLPHNPISLAASSAILGHPRARRGWGRAGLALYGVCPLESQDPVPLKPVMSLFTELSGVYFVQKNKPVGYGGIYRTKRPTTLGIIACGYADGYPRIVPSGIFVKIGEYLAPIIGRISMNLMSIDLTDCPIRQIGTPVELWGNHISINTVAKAAQTSPYELLCHIKANQRKTLASKNLITPL